MADFVVLKTGFERFDTAHAYGLSILLANAAQATIRLRNAGTMYQVSCPELNCYQIPVGDILDEFLEFPAADQIMSWDKQLSTVTLEMKNLDGLLSILFTSPGVRALSFYDLHTLSRFRADSLPKSIAKVEKAISSLRERSKPKRRKAQNNRLENLLADYDPDRPKIPMLVPNSTTSNLNVVMTIDPTFAYSNRTPISDRQTDRGHNLFVANSSYAVLLGWIGAVRFLRAQRLRDLTSINYYLPMVKDVVIDPNSAAQILYSSNLSSRCAAILRWLLLQDYYLVDSIPYSGLMYQLLLSQPGKQSISIDHGYLDSQIITKISKENRKRILAIWEAILLQSDQPIDKELLADFLVSPDSWEAHLDNFASAIAREAHPKLKFYTGDDIMDIRKVVDDQARRPTLGTILDRGDVGTREYGRAFRQLKDVNFGQYREILDLLDDVSTSAELFDALSYGIQVCELAKVNHNMIPIPTDEDFRLLIEDIEEFGCSVIAKTIKHISTIRNNPKNAKKDVQIGDNSGGNNG